MYIRKAVMRHGMRLTGIQERVAEIVQHKLHISSMGKCPGVLRFGGKRVLQQRQRFAVLLLSEQNPRQIPVGSGKVLVQTDRLFKGLPCGWYVIQLYLDYSQAVVGQVVLRVLPDGGFKQATALFPALLAHCFAALFESLASGGGDR